MSDYVKQLEGLKEKAQKNKEEKIRLEQQLKSLEEQKAKLLKELTPLEVKPEQLDALIKDLTKEIEEDLAKLNGLFNE